MPALNAETKVGSDAAKTSRTFWARGGKRAADLALALALIVVLSPLLILIGVLTPLTSPGAVFFFQDRAGRGGRRFRLFKFRTMRQDRIPDVKELVPLNHPDITRLGRLTRRFKLDELPQLFNVLLGDMALVGPRPTLPDQVDRYDTFQRRRLLVRPGLTGLAQVNTNALVSWDQRILYDVAYAARCGFLMDVGILLKTPLVVALGEDRFTRRFEDSPYARYIQRQDDDQDRSQ